MLSPDAQALLSLLRGIAKATSPREFGEALLRFLLSLVPQARAATLVLLNETAGAYEFVAAVGWDYGKLTPISFPAEKVRERYEPGWGPRVVRHIAELEEETWGRELAARLAEVGRPACTLVIPLRESGKLIGYINLDHPSNPDAFGEEDLKVLEPYAEIIQGLGEFLFRHRELAERERFLRFVFERMADAMYVTTLDGRILEANRAAEHQTGYSRAELLRMNIMHDLAAEEPTITWDTVNERLLRGEVVVFEERKRRKDGEEFWTEVAVALIDFRGMPATVSVNRDITERKRLQEELERRIAQLSALNRATRALAAELERDELIRAAIAAVRETTGADFCGLILSDEEGNPRRVVEAEGTPLIPFRMRERGFSAFVRKWKTPLIVHEIRPDGSTVPPITWPGGGTITANPLLVELGVRSTAMVPVLHGERLLGILSIHSRQEGAFRGAEELLSALGSALAVALANAELYEALKESEERYRTLFAESPVSLWLVDASTAGELLAGEGGIPVEEVISRIKVLDVNPATLSLFELQGKEELEQWIRGELPEDLKAPLRELIMGLRRGKWEGTYVLPALTARGRRLWVELAWRVLPGHEEDYRRVLVSIHDLTAEREAEEALRTLNAALTALGRTLDLEGLLRVVHDAAKKILRFDSFFVMAVDRNRRRLVPLIAIEEGKEISLPELPLDPRTSPTAWVAHHREPIFRSDIGEDPLPVPHHRVGKGVRGWIGLPLVAEGETIGVISFQSFSPFELGKRERVILSAFAAGVAGALRNALLHERVRKTAAKLRAIEEVSRKMKLARDSRELYELVLGAVEGIFGYRFCSILQAGEEGLVLVAQRGYPGVPHGWTLPYRDGVGVTVSAYLADEDIYVPDVTKDPRYIPRLPEGCEFAIPISVGGRKFGVLNVEHDQVDGIPPEDRDLLKIMADELAVSLVGLERLTGLEDLSRRLVELHGILQRLQRTGSAREMAAIATAEAVARLGFAGARISSCEGDGLRPLFQSGKSPPIDSVQGILMEILRTGKGVWGTGEELPGRPSFPEGLRGVIFLPLEDRGALEIYLERPPSRDDVSVAEILSRHVFEELRRVELEARLREEAIRDPLTGLYNRRFLDEILERELSLAARRNRPIALILADIDGFKAFNDTYGHLVGDQALKRVARALLECTRKEDYVFRWGGEEFVLVLPETGEEGARMVVERFKKPTGPLAEEPVVHLSMGYAVWDPQLEPQPTKEELFRRADARLLEEKGRKRRTWNP